MLKLVSSLGNVDASLTGFVVAPKLPPLNYFSAQRK